MQDTTILKEKISQTEHTETWVAFDRIKKKRLTVLRLHREIFGVQGGDSRFEADAKAYESLEWKPGTMHFLQIQDHAVDEEWMWYARESAGSNKTLAQWIQSGKLFRSLEITKRFGVLCNVLSELHSMGQVHRKINPTTIHLVGSDSVFLADPDVGHFLDPLVIGAAYLPSRLGPIDFLAPEQRPASAEPSEQRIAPDSRCDIWSLAACICFSATGQTPLELDFRRLSEDIRPAMEKAMQEDPGMRFQSMEEFKDALYNISKKVRPSLFSEPHKSPATSPPEEVSSSGTHFSQQNAAGAEPPTGMIAPNLSGIDLKCPQCGRSVIANSRFCPKCNRAYEEPCLVCQSPNAFWTKTCRSCKTDLFAAKQAMHERLYAQEQQVLRLRENYGHDKALPILRQISLLTHPDFAAAREWAKNLFPIVQKERRDIRTGIEGVRMQAKAILEEQKYDKVQELLAQVPAPLVDEEMRRMYQAAGECITEVDSLVREIRNSIAAKKYNTLLACVQRYLELKANDPEAQSLQEKIEKLTTITSVGGIKLRRIPSGRFYMGSHESDEFIRNNERPQHRVTISKPFFMSVYLITQGDFQRLMEYNPSVSTEGIHNPVDNVNWFSALEFCNKLSVEDGLEPYYELKNIKRRSSGAVGFAEVKILGGDGFRLPSEAEWEYTCRAGSITPWCFGDQILDVGEYAWYFDNSQGETQQIGLKKPNAWGLFDMHGNVMEWCFDWYGEFYYQSCGEAENPIGPETGNARTLRGGAWQFGAEATRSAYRNSCNPETSSSVIGFRILRDAQEDPM